MANSNTNISILHQKHILDIFNNMTEDYITISLSIILLDVDTIEVPQST